MKIKNFKKYFSEFETLYKNRPIKDNTGGMKSAHLFDFYCVLKELQPNLVVESGVWKGQGTWLIRQTVPNADVMSFDVTFSRLEYKDEEVQYLERDIKTVDWDKFFKDYPEKTPEKTLLFLDDHQNFAERLNFFNEAPFKHVVVEDNYPTNQGDILSPKKIQEGGEYVIDKDGIRNFYKLNPEIKNNFNLKVNTYVELPPLYKLEKTRWGDDWSEETYNTPEPIFSQDEVVDEEYYNDCYDYTWMCYMELK